MGDNIFGHNSKLAIINHVPTEVDNEQELLHEMRVKLGPEPDQERLLFHLRSARGKIHWAVNSYMRELLGGLPRQLPQQEPSTGAYTAPALLDAKPHSNNNTNSPSPDAASKAAVLPDYQLQVSCAALDNLPGAVLEAVVGWLDKAADVLALAQTCRTLQQVAMADAVWQSLFRQRWGAVVFPTHTGWAASGRKLRRMPYPGNADGASLAPVEPSLTGAVSSACSLTDAAPTSGPVSQQTSAGSSSSGVQAQHVRNRVPESHTFPMAPPAATQPALPTTRLQQAGSSVASREGGQAAGSGSHNHVWHDRYREQAGYEHRRACPCCGRTDARVVPIVYGFPSQPLLQGMRAGQLILGGDHLIQNCHCWACTTCNASFRTYPYESPQLWRADHDELALKTASSSRQGQAGGGAAGAGVAGGAHNPAGAPGSGDEEDNEDDALPMYTYEL